MIKLYTIENLKKYLEKQNYKLDDISCLFLDTHGMIPIYAFSDQVFIYSFIVPKGRIQGDYVKDLLRWNIMTPDRKCDVDNTGTLILNGSTPTFFLRYFEGNKPKNILEINQDISHALDIFWLDDRKAFCKINSIGDYEDIATMDLGDRTTLCTLRKDELNDYLNLTDSVLIRLFEFDNFVTDDIKEGMYKNNFDEIFANIRKVVTFAKACHSFRGFQIIRLYEKKKTDKQYASFKILDFKHGKECEWTCDPEKLGNYHVKSDLPYGTSPVFFRSEVLAMYKQDPSKYTIEDGLIDCRRQWLLHYDTNKEGQIFTYIKELSFLPYSEQLYWKSFNEEPRVGISKKALEQDFKGNWYDEYDPLAYLKHILETFPTAKEGNNELVIWKMPKSPETRDIKTLNYVITDSIKEYEDQILILDQIIIEGLQAKSINKIAEHLSCRNKELKSLKQLIECIKKQGIETSDFDCLRDLHDLRTMIKAHVSSDRLKGDLKLQHRELIEKCDKAMYKLVDIINKGTLDIP